MTEVVTTHVDETTTTNYEDWNSALATAFFGLDRAGDLVYLDKDDDAFSAACDVVGVRVEDADYSLAEAVRNHLCRKDTGRMVFADFDLKTKEWVAKRRKALRDSMEVPAPPHIALLTLFSLAAERVGGANKATGAVESGYYSSLEELLSIPASESGRTRTSFMQSSEAYWESLSLWLEDQNGQRGMPSAYALMHRYVGLPISQALVRARERKNLKKMFEEQGFFAGMSVSHTDMYDATDIWIRSARSSANSALVKMWEASAEVKNRIVEIALQEFATWEGGEAAGEGNATSAQKNQRCLLTLRDHRVMLRSEMRFGLMVGTNGSAGDTCRIAGAEEADREFVLEQFAAASAGFDFRAVGVDVGSALSGDLRLVVNDDQTMRHFPKNIVIFTRDPFSAGYVESDRINAAVPSRILVRNRPDLMTSVDKVLADAAQPGYKLLTEGSGGVPTGWTVYTDVVLLRAPGPTLVEGRDLSAFQPRLSTQMTITGGLKMPGHMPRWSALNPIQVVIASETDEPVDLAVLTRNEETLLTEEYVLAKGLQVPAAVDLNEIPDNVQDFTLALRRGKTTLQTLAVKLRSSREPDPSQSERFRSLCHDLGSSLWPVQSVPNDTVTASGMDGISLSAPTISHRKTTVAARPDWTIPGGMKPKARALIVKGPPEDSCIVTGKHRFIFPVFDGKRPKTRWMYGVCDQCGMSKRQPTVPKNKKATEDNSRLETRRALPELAPGHISWAALIDALFFLGAGSRREFSMLARQIEDSAVFESNLLLDLESLGVIELERNAELEVIQWESAATCIGELTDGSWLLTGYWNGELRDDVLDACRAVGATVGMKAAQCQAMDVIDNISHEEIAAIAETFEIAVVQQTAAAIAAALPSLSEVGDGLERRDMPHADSYEYFDTPSATWLDVETAVLPGLYRVTQGFTSRYYYRNTHDVAKNHAAVVTVQLGKHLAALGMNRPLIAYTSAESTLSVPTGAGLPGVYARAAVMGSGDLPLIRRSDRSINYMDLPPATAEALIGKLTS